MESISRPLICYLAVLSFPMIGLLLNTFFFKLNPVKGSYLAAISIWTGFAGALICWLLGIPFLEKTEHFGFLANELSWTVATFILFVSGIVHCFSFSFMQGDRRYRPYFLNLTLLTITTLLMVASDNVLILTALWGGSNLLLVLLMIHKWEWRAARNSGILALKTLILGLLFLLAGSSALSLGFGTFSLQAMTLNAAGESGLSVTIALILIMLAAFSQSGAWPFHAWLLSSLNSPTPVSALMHAGLVNGGGLLLARFAPLYLSNSLLLKSLFSCGVLTLILGGMWKLMQSDIKRMLACSTMGQMGYMIMQCGLGLFPAAVAHLLWHGLFKAYLFLRTGSTLEEKRRQNGKRACSIPAFCASLFCGLAGAWGFALGSKIDVDFSDTTLVLLVFAWIAAAQFAHTVLEEKQTAMRFAATALLCLIAGAIYGLSVYLIEYILSPLSVFVPQRLDDLHIAAIVLIALMWLAINLKTRLPWENTIWWRKLYVSMLNASQPDPKTITSIRKEYEF